MPASRKACSTPAISSSRAHSSMLTSILPAIGADPKRPAGLASTVVNDAEKSERGLPANRGYLRCMASHPTADHVVAAVAMHGPATKEEIAYSMGVSPEGALMAIRAAVRSE